MSLGSTCAMTLLHVALLGQNVIRKTGKSTASEVNQSTRRMPLSTIVKLVIVTDVYVNIRSVSKKKPSKIRRLGSHVKGKLIMMQMHAHIYCHRKEKSTVPGWVFSTL
jgi:hypothetical protein